MINKKSIISTAVVSAFIITIYTIPTVSATESTFTPKTLNKGFMLAQTQAHDHSEDKGHKSKHKQGKSHKGSHSGNKHGKNHSYAHMIISHADALALTDVQLGKIVRLHLIGTQKHQNTKQKMRKNMMTLHKISMKPDTDDATLRQLSNEHTDVFNAMIEQHISERKAVHNILTPDQIDKLKTMKMNHGMHGDNNQKSKHNHH